MDQNRHSTETRSAANGWPSKEVRSNGKARTARTTCTARRILLPISLGCGWHCCGVSAPCRQTTTSGWVNIPIARPPPSPVSVAYLRSMESSATASASSRPSIRRRRRPPSSSSSTVRRVPRPQQAPTVPGASTTTAVPSSLHCSDNGRSRRARASTIAPSYARPRPGTAQPPRRFVTAGRVSEARYAGRRRLGDGTQTRPLKYYPGEVDGKFDSQTWQGVMAFQKFNADSSGPRQFDVATQERLFSATVPGGVIPNGGLPRIEVDINRQVAHDFRRVRTLPRGRGFERQQQGVLRQRPAKRRRDVTSSPTRCAEMLVRHGATTRSSDGSKASVTARSAR